MAAFGQIGYSQASNPSQPSGAIWGDCPSADLMSGDQGFLDFKDFTTRLPQTADGASVTWATNSGSFAWDTGGADHLMNFTTGTTAGNDTAVATRPLGPITPGSGQKIWFEAYIAMASVSVAHGVFVGLANRASLGAGLLISAASGTKNSNLIGTSSGAQSFVGFWMHGDTVTNFDAVYANNISTALSPTTIAAPGTSATGGGLILANVLTANANNPNPGNPNFTPPLPPGALAAAGATNTQAQYVSGQVSAANAFVKLGIRYDGQQYLYFYVNGTQVAKALVDSTFDTTNDYAGVVEVVAGTNAAAVLKCGFAHTAAKLF